MLRIMHIVDSLGLGGAERHLLHMSAYLHERGVEQIVVQLYGSEQLSPDFAARGVKTINLELQPGLAHLPQMYWKFLTCARQWRPQVISTQLTTSDIIGRLAARRLAIPSLSIWQVTCYGPLATSGYSLWVRLVMSLLKTLDRFSTTRQSQFVAVSKAVEKSYREALGVAASQCTLIPNTIDLGRFPTASPPRDFARTGTRLVHVGRHAPQKGLPTLLEALTHVSPRLNVTLNLFGGGPLTAGLERYVRLHDLSSSVNFMGVVANIVPAFLDSDIFVLPSFYEGLSLAYLEALAAGLPVIASDIPENREIDPNSLATLFFKPGDSRALAVCIEKLAADKDLRSELGGRAQGLARRFGIDQVGPAIYEVLESMSPVAA